MKLDINMNGLNSTDLMMVTELIRRGVAKEVQELVATPIEKPKQFAWRKPYGGTLECSKVKEPLKRRRDINRRYKAIQKILDIIEARPNKTFKFSYLSKKAGLIGGNKTWVKKIFLANKGVSTQLLRGGKMLVSKNPIDLASPSLTKSRRRERRRGENLDQILELIRSKPGKVFTFSYLLRKLKIKPGNWGQLKRRLDKAKGITLERTGKIWKIYSGEQTAAKEPVLREHKYMHRTKSPYNRFRSERTKYYMIKQNMDYLTACRAAQADWAKLGGRDFVEKPKAEFPAIGAIKPEFVPILRDILANLTKNPGSEMDYQSTAYTLGLKSFEQYNKLIQEILDKVGEIKYYFSLKNSPHTFVVNNSKLCWK